MIPPYARKGADLPPELPKDLLDEVREGMRGNAEPNSHPVNSSLEYNIGHEVVKFENVENFNNNRYFPSVPKHISDFVKSLVRAAKSGVFKDPKDSSKQGGGEQ